MKTMKWKLVVAAVITAAIMGTGFSVFASGNKPGSAAKKSRSFSQAKVAINKDLNRINLQQAKIEGLKKEIGKERSSGQISSETRNEWLKAKADLKRDKAYLAADKRELLKAHNGVIRERTEKVNKQRAEMWVSKIKLDADLAAGKPSAVAHAQAVVDAQHSLKQSEESLKRAKLSRNADLLVVNREIRDAKGQSAFVLSVEDGAAKLQNLALK